MALPKLIPALADLTQDIAGPLPVELFRDWVAGAQDLDKATSLLRPFEITGTVVSTDSSGLSRLTEEKDLLDVLALISHPKEIVHAFGTSAGGRAIGIWVADNTEMHYPSEIPVASIVDAMVDAQARIAAEAKVRIGMCVHAGHFYEIAGGLYGGDAETVEYLAEQFAAPGEILLTQPVAARIGADAGRLEPRRELNAVYPPGVLSLTGTPRATPVPRAAAHYPYPFPDDFFQSLVALRTCEAPAALRAEIYRSLLHDRVIVFVARERDASGSGDITALLDNLATNVVMEAVVNGSAAKHRVASMGGGLAILCFEDAQEAVEASLAIRGALVESGLPVKIGIDAGPVLEFTNPQGRGGISGDAVNIASKISEDLGVLNMISATSRVVRSVRGVDGAVPFHGRISHVAISGVRW